MADMIEYTTTGKPHPYHLVRPSIWPLLSACSGGLLATGAVMYMHEVQIAGEPIGLKGIWLGLFAVILCMIGWWKDIIHETVSENVHNRVTEIGLRFGMINFIASEVMFFVAFFWAFFSSAFYPSAAIGFVWPPEAIETVDPFHLPLLMTMILLLSGSTVSWAHHAILHGDQKESVLALGVTVFLGVMFLCFQVYEYSHLKYGFTEGIYPSTFYMATGFHGFHVFVGTIFLIVCWIRAMLGHFTKDKHFGFEAAAWYWHFVDVVWLFLFFAIYLWGNEIGTDMSALAQ